MRFLCVALLVLAVCRKPPAPKTSGKNVSVQWTASTTPNVSYNVYRASGTCASATAYTKINPSAVTVTSYTDANVPVGVLCYYATSYLISAGTPESIASNKQEVTVPEPSEPQPQPPTNLTVTPPTATLGLNQRQQFTAMRGRRTRQVSWSITPSIGSITQDGLYTAPSSIQGNNVKVEVRAVEAGVTAAAQVTIRK